MSKNLKEYLELCKAEYYAGHPIISDDQYDHLEDICGEDLTVGTNKGRVRHWYRMYSLQKFYMDDDNIPMNTGHYVETPKLDGASLAVRYLDGKLDSVVTRGNGEYGEDVTHLFQKIHRETCIPHTISFGGAVQITGEIVAPEKIPNARNYAAGALNLKDADEFYFKEIEFFAYGIRPYITELYRKDLEYLVNQGFITVNTHCSAHLPKDGTVFRMMNNKEYEEKGYTSKHPRGAFALKERTEGVKTIIKDVIWQTGKTGKVTPVALLEPIVIDGATVSRATLNNPGFIEALGVQIGDSVMVERAGGIIPRIIRKAE